MSADPLPEILTVRVSREELSTLKTLALGLGNIARLLGAGIEAKSAILVLLAVIHRAEEA